MIGMTPRSPAAVLGAAVAVGWLAVAAAPAGGDCDSITWRFDERSQGQETPRESAVPTRVPFELEEHLVWLPVRVNGSGPFTFLLDSAAQFTVLDSSVAARLGIAPSQQGVSQGSGGAVSVGLARNVTVALGGRRLAVDPVVLQPLDFIHTGVGRAADGIIGAELFLRHVVEIDYTGLGVTLSDPNGYVYAGRGKPLPLTLWQGRVPLVPAALALPGRTPIEGTFQVDTGSAQVLTLCAPFVDRNHLLDIVPKTIPSSSMGVGGESPDLVGRLEGFRLGSRLLPAPIVRFSRAIRGVFAMDAFAGNIGGELLSRFTVVFDYARQRIYLEPNARLTDPFLYNMSGIPLELEDPRGTAFAVRGVTPGSPAAEAGLQVGDAITGIDGRPAAEYRLSSVRRMFKEEGREVTLRVRRDAQTREVAIKLRKMI